MAQPEPPSEADNSVPRAVEARVLLRRVPWNVYEALVEACVEESGVRMSYLKGDLEIMTPSPRHERRKSLVGRLLEAYAEELDLVLNAYGSTTFKSEASERGAEPDECYVLREVADEEGLVAPDLVIEIVETSWKIDKLEIYRGLGVPEVWVWRSLAPEIHVLHESGYIAGARSRLLPELDVEMLASFSGRADQMRAVKEYRARLRAMARH
jgi:Uma2 family endonuclease